VNAAAAMGMYLFMTVSFQVSTMSAPSAASRRERTWGGPVIGAGERRDRAVKAREKAVNLQD
jgi:hypothetical protein